MSSLIDFKGLKILDDATPPGPPGEGGGAIHNNFIRLGKLGVTLASVDPDVDADSDHDYLVGSRWFNSSTQIEFICTDATPGTAVWSAVAADAAADLATHAAATAAHGASGAVVGTTNTQTLSNKTLTAPTISSITNGGTLSLPSGTDTLLGRATSDTLTNKSISGSSNTLTNLPAAQLTGSIADARLSSNVPLLNATVNNFANRLTAAAVCPASVQLTDGSSISTDAKLGNHFWVTLGGNRTLANPTNPTDGQKVTWELIQDGTGGRTLTLDTKFVLGTDVNAVTLTSTAGKRDFLGAIYNATTDKWYVVSFVKGY